MAVSTPAPTTTAPLAAPSLMGLKDKTKAFDAKTNPFDNKKFEISGITDHFDKLSKEIGNVKPGVAGEMGGFKGFSKYAGAAALGGLVPAIPASLSAFWAKSADSKLDKSNAALTHAAGKLAEGVKIPAWLKGTAVATLLVAAAGFVSGMGQKAAKRIVQYDTIMNHTFCALRETCDFQF